MYPQMIRRARAAGQPEAAVPYVCPVCGATYVNHPPEVVPTCGTPRAKLKQIE
jgi:rubrerythrin